MMLLYLCFCFLSSSVVLNAWSVVADVLGELVPESASDVLLGLAEHKSAVGDVQRE